MRYLLVILAFATVILPGIGHGLMTDRWFVSKDLEEFTARLANIRIDMPDWQGEDLTINPRQIAQSDLSAYVAKQFTRRTDGRKLSVMIGCGRPGPVSVHGPDICYEGSGYSASNPITKFSLSSPSSSLAEEFYETTFMKSEPVPEFLEVYWSLNCKGTWEIPANPRLAFGGQKALYKLYIVCPYSRENERKEAQVDTESFLRVFLPELRKSLF